MKAVHESQELGFEHVYTLVIALLPILSKIKSPLSALNCGTFLLLACAPFCIIASYNSRNMTTGIKSMCPYLVYILISSLIQYYGGDDNLNSLASFAYMLAICILTLSFSQRASFKIDLARKYIEWTSLAASVVLFIQLVVYYLTGHAFQIISQGMIYEQESFSASLAIAGGIPRFSSFFIEPSHFAQYVSIGVVSALFKEGGKTPNIRIALLLTMGIVATTSGIGMLVIAVIWAIWFILHRSKHAENKALQVVSNGFFFLAAFAALLFIGMQFDFIRTSVGRLFGVGGLENAFVGRTWSFVLYEKLDYIDKIFGVGYAQTTGYYMTSLVSTLYTIGAVGLLTIVIGFVYLFFHANDFSKVLILLFAIFFCVSLVFTQLGIAFYYSLIVAGTTRHYKRNSD